MSSRQSFPTKALNSIELAESRGYKPGQHVNQDSEKRMNRYVPAVIKPQERVLRLYALWRSAYGTYDDHSITSTDSDMLRPSSSDVPLTPPTDDDTMTPPADRGSLVFQHNLGPDTPRPSLAKCKDFIRFYIEQSKGSITSNGKASRDTTLTHIEWFFAGFTRVTKKCFTEDYRQEIYWWLRKVVCEQERVVENVRRPKHNFTKDHLDIIMMRLWCFEDPKFLHERTRTNVAFLIPSYTWSGARISAFFEGGGLRYKDIHIDLKRYANGQVKPAYRLDQRWVKNNRDPENVKYGIAGEADEVFIYDETTFLLSMAMADGALHGLRTWNDIWTFNIPEDRDHVQLRWTDEAMEMPILRRVDSEGRPTREPMLKREFERIWKELLLSEGYTGSAGMHMVRRALGKKLDERYTEAVRSQHITQSDTRVYGRDYVADCSSANGKAAFLDLPANHETVEHFQGLGRQREIGLPTKLPAALSASIDESVEMRQLRALFDKSPPGSSESSELQRQMVNTRNRLQNSALKQHQHDWVKQRRDDIIAKKGMVATANDGHPPHILLSLVEERKTLADLAVHKERMTQEQIRGGQLALYSLLCRDLSTLYRPDEHPIDGRCPVCQQEMQGIKKRSRSDHIHGCRRKQIAKQRSVKPEDMRYCYDCFRWFAIGKGEWTSHCDEFHLLLDPRACDRATYDQSTVKEYRCGACAEPGTPEASRLRAYQPVKFWPHLEGHITGINHWPSRCIYFGCAEEFSGDQAMRYHLQDAHYWSARPKKAGKRKRGISTEAGTSDDGSSAHALPAQGLPGGSKLFLAPDQFDMDNVDPQLKLGYECSDDPTSTQQRSQILLQEPDDLIDSRPISTTNEYDAERGTLPASGTTATQALGNESESGVDDEFPVEAIVGRSGVWYLIKWVGYSDAFNDWRRAKDIGAALVNDYDQSGKKNDHGRLIKKRTRQGEVQYLMRWKDLPPRYDSWESAINVDTALIENFQSSDKPAKRRRTKRRY